MRWHQKKQKGAVVNKLLSWCASFIFKSAHPPATRRRPATWLLRPVLSRGREQGAVGRKGAVETQRGRELLGGREGAVSRWREEAVEMEGAAGRREQSGGRQGRELSEGNCWE